MLNFIRKTTANKLNKFLIASLLAAGPALSHAVVLPSNLVATAVSTSTIHLSWVDESNDEVGYRILDGNNTPISPSLPQDTTFYIESGLANNTGYIRKVQVYKTGESLNTPPMSVFTLTHLPTNLEALSKTNTSITISWSCLDSSNPNIKFGLERASSPTSAFYTLLGLTSGYAGTIFVDNGLTINSTYFYRMYSFNGDNVASGPTAVVALRTKNTAPDGLAAVTAFSAQDRTITLSWPAISDPIASYVRITRRSSDGVQSVFTVPSDRVQYTDTQFAVTVSTFDSYSYTVTTLNADGEPGVKAATASVVPNILFEYADTDGDGNLESWDIVNSSYSDPVKNPVTENRIIQSFLAGTTRVLLIDVYRRSTIPKALDFDSYPDVVWMPMSGVVTVPAAKDFDGDGLTDLGIDLDGDGLSDGAITNGIYKAFGMLQVSVVDSKGKPIQDAMVTISIANFVIKKKTDSRGQVVLNLTPNQINSAEIVVESNNYVRGSMNINLNPWDTNTVSMAMAASEVTSNGLNARNYPNPVLPGSPINIVYYLQSSARVQMDIYDFNWRLIRRVLDETQSPGINALNIPAIDDKGDDLDRGLYFAVIRTSGENQILKVVVR